MDELKNKGKKVIENIGEKRQDLIQKWEDESKEFIGNFLLLFGREGRIVIYRFSLNEKESA
jgi:choline-phosphate cytidylyltransferase